MIRDLVQKPPMHDCPKGDDMKRAIAILCLVGCQASLLSAQVPSTGPADMVSRGKTATALVDGGRAGSGTAFCIHPSGLFLTNAHVVDGLAAADIKIVLTPGEAGEKQLPATVIRKNAEVDLALLKVVSDKPLPCLELGSIDTLVETAELTAFGYPFGKALAFEDGKYPSISVSVGRVTSLRKAAGKLEAIQLDASLNPGNSGGPVLDKSGKVVGVVMAGIHGAALNFSIPVNQVSEFLVKPELEFTPPGLTKANMSQTAKFSARLVWFVPAPKGAKVDLVLITPQEQRKFPMVADREGYSVQAVPVPPVSDIPDVRLTGRFPKGVVEGVARDITFSVGGKSVKLSSLQSIEFGPTPKAMLSDGAAMEGPVAGLSPVTLTLGETRVMVDMTKAQTMEAVSLAAPLSLDYKIVVSDGGKVLDEFSGPVPIEGIGLVATTSGKVRLLTVSLGAGVSMKLVEIPAGSFTMGEGGEAHKVNITKKFYMGQYEVTVAQFDQFVKATGYKTDAEKEGWGFGIINFQCAKAPLTWRKPNYQQKDDFPACLVSWSDAKEFCDWLSKKTGRKVHLPTEAQWEYACRAGTTTRYPWGDDGSAAKKMARCAANFRAGELSPVPVGSYPPNAWGLYDMIGNVFEYASDWLGPLSRTEARDPAGPVEGRQKVRRGGAWDKPMEYNGSSSRQNPLDEFNDRATNTGFRVAMD